MAEQPRDGALGTLETIHAFDSGPMPTGVSVSLAHDPRLLWPDTMSVADGYLYVTAAALNSPPGSLSRGVVPSDSWGRPGSEQER